MRKIVLCFMIIFLVGCNKGENTDSIEENIELQNKIENLETELTESESIIQNFEETNKINDLLDNESRVDFSDNQHESIYDLFIELIDNNVLDSSYVSERYQVDTTANDYETDMYNIQSKYSRLWEIEMQYAYKRLYDILDDDIKPVLKDSQIAWNSFIDNAVHNSYSIENYFEETSLFDIRLNHESYIRQMYRKRAILLLEYLYLLKGVDGVFFVNTDLYNSNTQYDEEEIMQLLNDELYYEVSIINGFNHIVYISELEEQKQGVLLQIRGYDLKGKYRNYSTVYEIDILNDKFESIQTIEVPWTCHYYSRSSDYGLLIEDWNFDGWIDIGIFAWEGGTMGNTPSYYWFWNPTNNKFEFNDEISDLSNYGTINVNKADELINLFSRSSSVESGTISYKWENKVLIPSESNELIIFEDEVGNLDLYELKRKWGDEKWIEISKKKVESERR